MGNKLFKEAKARHLRACMRVLRFADAPPAPRVPTLQSAIPIRNRTPQSAIDNPQFPLCRPSATGRSRRRHGS